MQRSITHLFAPMPKVAIGLLILAVVGGVAFFKLRPAPVSQQKEMTKNTTPAVASPVPTVATAQTEGTTRYMANIQESKIEWSSEKKLVEWKHNGTVQIQSGEIVRTMEKDVVKISGRIIVDMGTLINLDGGKPNEALIKHLKSPDFFDVEKYPTATLAFTAMPDPAAAVEKGFIGWKAEGQMTIKGKTNPITFTAVSTENTDAIIMATSSLTINRAQYEVKFGSESFFKNLGDKVIKDEIPLKVTIYAKKV
jgi:polyisoprenoid-binding protein YceI